MGIDLRRFSGCSLVVMLFVLVAGSLAAVDTHASVPVKMTLKNEVQIHGAAVRVGDVVEHCEDKRLSGLKLFASPSWGHSRSVGRDEIQKRIARVTRQKVFLTGSEKIMLFRPGGDRVREVRQRIEAEITARTENIDGLTFELLFPDRPVMLPWGDLKIDYTVPEQLSGGKVLRCQILVEGKSVKSLSVTCQFTRVLAVPVATRRLTRGDTLRTTDVEWEDRTYSNRVPEVVSASALNNNYRVKRVIRAGDVVTSTAVEPHPVVRVGQVIDLVINRSAIRITTRARALQSGWIGSRIRLQKLSDNSYVYARVSNKGVAIHE
jgi:flagella basal body P-ring formation protein FlgA